MKISKKLNSKMIKNVPIVAQISGGAVIFKKEESGEIQFLLVNRKSVGDCSFPKGRSEKDESLQSTAIRESLEETGWDIEILDYLDKTEYQTYSEERGIEYWRTVYWFLAKALKKSKDIENPDEVESAIWVNFEEAMQKLTRDNDKNIFKKAEEIIKTKFS